MENYYTAYTKTIQNKTHFFVKKYVVFPEFKNVAPALESYGMHTDFDKACAIALITDPKIKQDLLNNIENNTQHAKVIELNNDSATKRKAQ
jgi:hypothetical protein